MNCKNCGKSLPPALPGAHRAREFCNAACKQADYRRRKASLAPSDEAIRTIETLEQEKAALEREMMRLRNLLDIERRYHLDTQARGFKVWLKKQPATALTRRLLANDLVPPRGSRGTYEAHLRRMKCSSEEMQEFEHLWKALLLQS